MTKKELLALFQNKEINKMEINQQLKEMDDDMMRAHGGTYRCDICTYTRHVDCPPHCTE
jgi:hypothetical protein